MRIRTTLAALLGLGLGAPALRADDGPPSAAGRPHIPEVAEMAWSILKQGADMGPGQAWFHPAQGRYGWPWLAGRFDADKDGMIAPEEWRDGAASFLRLDRDRDGVITPEDLDWSDASPYLRGRAMARGRFGAMDANSNGRVTREEWAALFEKAARGKGFLTTDDLADVFYTNPPRPRRPTPEQKARAAAGMPSRLTLFQGLLSGEIGSPFEGPAIDEPAPDFRLKTHDGQPEVALSAFRGDRPVVLIFGSFT